MALQTSGQISLQDIAAEFGGTAPHGLTEYYAAAAGIPASGEISIQDFYGASAGPAYLDTQTVTVGVELSQYVSWYGYSNSINLGSISDGTSNIYGGASILQIANLNGNSTFLTIEGSRANSGWTTMTINGIDFNRADASYSTTTTNTAWTWSPSSNPFGTTEGAEVTVTWI